VAPYLHDAGKIDLLLFFIIALTETLTGLDRLEVIAQDGGMFCPCLFRIERNLEKDFEGLKAFFERLAYTRKSRLII